MTTVTRIRLLSANEQSTDTATPVLALQNDADPLVHAPEIADATRVELNFPAFTDGRAYSQAYVVRRRLGFKGDLRATGEVLVDQLQQMERMGFSSAVLKDGADSEAARQQLERFAAFYQADVTRAAPFRDNDLDD